MGQLSTWLNEQLSILLNFSVPDEMIEYILGIENYRDLEDYLKTLLDFENPKHAQFMAEFFQKRNIGTKGQLHAYQKPELKSLDVPSVRKEKKKNKGKTPHSETMKLPSPPPAQYIPVEPQGKKKQKFVNLYSQEGQAKDIILLKGRHKCDCQASKHKLINNCLKCGRIVCEQEGSGPCFFCGTLVCSWEEQQILNSNTKQSNHLYKKLLESSVKGLDAAVEQRNRLLEYDKTSVRRTKVIDDESDYFASNSVWLSKGEREKLKKKEEEMRAKRHASRLDKKITFDFAGRKVVEEDDSGEFCEIEDYNENLDMSSLSSALCEIDRRLGFPELFSENMDAVINIESDKKHDNKWNLQERLYPRIQDRELLEMSDEGHSLSMHQPWASLLVAGIKMHEGRTWYTAHRGRLWIAAAAKTPTQQEIKELEDLYRCLKDENLKFPSQYPVSCLLGYVNVVDCLPQEEYRARFPEGECTSPYVFMCEDAHELPVRFPIQGKHKIYKLDPKIHQAAQKSLQKFAKIKVN